MPKEQFSLSNLKKSALINYTKSRLTKLDPITKAYRLVKSTTWMVLFTCSTKLRALDLDALFWPGRTIRAKETFTI